MVCGPRPRPVDSVRGVDYFSGVICPNRMQDDQVMAIPTLAKSGQWFIFAHILKVHTSNDGQTNIYLFLKPIVKWPFYPIQNSILATF